MIECLAVLIETYLIISCFSCPQQIEQEKAYLDKVQEEFQREKEIRENAERKVRHFSDS